MASAQSKIFNILLRLINKKSLLKRQFKKGNFNAFTSPIPPQRIFRDIRVEQYQVNDRNVFTLSPRHNGSKKHILYLHGGAYVTGFTKLHWYFLKDLITNTHCSITAPDYPLAPQHTYKDVLEMMMKIHQKLLLTIDPDNLILMGDSAGGGLALSLAQKIKDENLPQPNHIILLSPWLDITVSNPDITAIDPTDPFTGIEGLRLAGKAYAGMDDPTGYLLSPINGSLAGLGKISVFTGTKEILVADSRKLKTLMETQGIPVNYREYEDMVHVWMLLHFPESRKARNEIFKLVKSPDVHPS